MVNLYNLSVKIYAVLVKIKFFSINICSHCSEDLILVFPFQAFIHKYIYQGDENGGRKTYAYICLVERK